MIVNIFDCDGVLYLSPHESFKPRCQDIIVSGRTIDRFTETSTYLKQRGIHNKIYLKDPAKFPRTREGSGQHKAATIKQLQQEGYTIDLFFEDDPIQSAIINQECPEVNVVLLVHNLTEK